MARLGTQGSRAVFASAVALTAFAAWGGSSAGVTDSGVRGKVAIGPTCPVVIEGDPSCEDQPYEATIRILREGRLVARARSGEDGRFRRRLEPGRYVLDPVEPNGTGPPTAGSRVVRVYRHRFTFVTIAFDSGIR
jgi:hypothetical protein